MEKLEWYCLKWDTNAKRPRMVNVMFAIDLDDLRKKLKYKGKKPSKYNSVKNYEELKEYLQNEFFYHFWCKCEHEITVNSWPYVDRSTEVRVDIYDQIVPNIDRITEYVARELKLDFKRKGVAT
ncbi:MAG: hypothetical protein IKP68_05185 [Clostridia bacterium]|nr:hypothetical protein [Clostridia bacterium]